MSLLWPPCAIQLFVLVVLGRQSSKPQLSTGTNPPAEMLNKSRSGRGQILVPLQIKHSDRVHARTVKLILTMEDNR
jgi:hypothetical protein